MTISRSENMRRIRSRNTKPEILLRKALWAVGIRGYRLHARTGVGRPDLVFPGPRVAVYIDGCQWHGCPDHYVRPRSNAKFWAQKLRQSVNRDRRQTLELERLGWRVIRIWEHQVYETVEDCIALIRRAIRAEQWSPAPRWCVVRVDELEPGPPPIEQRLLEMLRNPCEVDIGEGRRVTAKWRRPR